MKTITRLMFVISLLAILAGCSQNNTSRTGYKVFAKCEKYAIAQANANPEKLKYLYDEVRVLHNYYFADIQSTDSVYQEPCIFEAVVYGENKNYRDIYKNGNMIIYGLRSRIEYIDDGFYKIYNFRKIDSIRSFYLSGYLNQAGKIIVPIQNYEYLGSPNDGAITYIDSISSGYYDLTGKKFDMTKKNFKLYSNFKNGRALAIRNGKFGLVTKAGNVIIPFEYDGFEQLGEHNPELKGGVITMYSGRCYGSYEAKKTVINCLTGKKIN